MGIKSGNSSISKDMEVVPAQDAYVPIPASWLVAPYIAKVSRGTLLSRANEQAETVYDVIYHDVDFGRSNAI